MIIVNVAKDFTRFPAGRYKRNGDTSGEAFRERFLENPLRQGEDIVIELDGTVGYGSSFLEEAFGGVVRALHLPAGEVLKHLKIESTDPSLKQEVTDYILDAERSLR
jgi:hypothetical protein